MNGALVDTLITSFRRTAAQKRGAHESNVHYVQTKAAALRVSDTGGNKPALVLTPDGPKLKMYGLFKQAGAGDVTGSRPGFADIVGRAKHDAWASLKGTGTEDAMQQYIDLVESLKSA